MIKGIDQTVPFSYFAQAVVVFLHLNFKIMTWRSITGQKNEFDVKADHCRQLINRVELYFHG